MALQFCPLTCVLQSKGGQSGKKQNDKEGAEHPEHLEENEDRKLESFLPEGRNRRPKASCRKEKKEISFTHRNIVLNRAR